MVDIENGPGGPPDAWTVCQKITYVTKLSISTITISVLPGFITDGASIPRFFWRVIGPPIGYRYTAAAIIHDALYSSKGNAGCLSRKSCDCVFYNALCDSNLPSWQPWVMWAVVRVAGWFYWNRTTVDSSQESALDFLEVEIG